MKLVVKTLAGRKHSFEVQPTDRIDYVKQQLEQKTGIKPVQQRLVFKGKIIPDVSTVEEAGLNADTPIQLIVQLKGGQM